MPAEDVKEFWATMWNNTQEGKNDYSDYLREMVPCPDTPADFFPAFSEVQEIIARLLVKRGRMRWSVQVLREAVHLYP